MTAGNRLNALGQLRPHRLPFRHAGAILLLVCAHAPAASAFQASAPAKPGIFAVGFTDTTDTSTRLVFTTSEPMSTTVEVFDRKVKSESLAQPSFDEIHEVAIDSLTKQTEYSIVITGTGKDGKTTSREVNFRPAQLPPSQHKWPGYTIFSSSTNGDNPEALDLLAHSGATMARIEIGWDGVYPKRGMLNQAFLDKWKLRVQEMKKRGIEPLVILDYCVKWAKPYTDTTMTWRNVNFGPPDELADWEQYVRTVVTALHGVARYYEIWNEPDAGYLATGSFVERPNVPPPIGRPPFKDNTAYWIGDRYAPMIESARKVIGELEPGALVMNGGWNRDYAGGRGDILLQRGVGPSLDLYAYHVYSHSPTSFSHWYKEIDGGFRTNIDRIFKKNDTSFPLAVTEWGTPAWTTPAEGKGFASFPDSQLFYIKSTFYFLSMERFEILSQFAIGLGSSNRDKDPTFFQLVNEDTPHQPIFTATYATYDWLAHTFGSKTYHALPVQIDGKPDVKAYAIQLKDSGDIYLAAWQDGPVDDNGIVSPLPARTLSASISGVNAGAYTVSVLDVDGKPQSQTTLKGAGSLTIQLPIPAATTTAESGVYLARITRSR